MPEHERHQMYRHSLHGLASDPRIVNVSKVVQKPQEFHMHMHTTEGMGKPHNFPDRRVGRDTNSHPLEEKEHRDPTR